MDTSKGQGGRVRSRRKALGLSQERLARDVNVTRNTVVRWEGGAGIDGANLIRLADALGVDARWLLTGQVGSPEASSPLTDG